MQMPHRSILVVAAATFLNAVGFGIIIPVTPGLIMEVSSEGLADAAIWGSWLLVAYAVMQFVFSPIIGSLSDAYGRRPILLLSSLVFAVDYLLMAIAPTLAWLFAARIVGGLAASTNAVADATVADVIPPEERIQTFGLVRGGFYVGFIVGPTIGGLMAEFGTRAPFYVTAALGLVNFVMVLLYFHEPLKEENRRPFTLARSNPIGALKILKHYPGVATLIAVMFLVTLAQFSLSSTWAYSMIARFDWRPAEIGLSLAYVGVLGVVVNVYLTRVLTPRVTRGMLTAIGFATAFVGYLTYAFASEGWVIYVGLSFGALGALATLPISAIMTEQVEANNQGELQGALASVNSVATIIGPILMLQLFAGFNAPGAQWQLPGAPFLMSAMITVGAALLAFRVAGHRLPSGTGASRDTA